VKFDSVTNYIKHCVRKAKLEIKNHIEPVDENGEYKKGSKLKAFNYYTFTNWCANNFNEYENVPDLSYLIRDLALEDYDNTYNAMEERVKLAEMHMLD
jgi:hypothetical protein